MKSCRLAFFLALSLTEGCLLVCACVLCCVLVRASTHTHTHTHQEDILCKDMLDNMKAKYPQKVEVFYTLDRPPAGWTGFSGYLNPKP